MKHTKKIVTLGSVLMAGAAFGQYSSPELVFVTDGGGVTPAGTTVQAQIERYDPYTGAYLGAFGAGYVTSPAGVTIVGADAYVCDPFTVGSTEYSRIDKFNFSTGAYDGSFFNSGPDWLFGCATFGSNLLASDYGINGLSGAVYTFNSAGQITGANALPNNFKALGIAADGAHDYVGGSGTGLISFNLNSNGLSTGQNFLVGAGNTYEGVTANGGSIYACGADSAGAGVIDQYTSSGGLIGEYVNTNHALLSTAFGHNGMMYALGGANQNINSIYRFDSAEPLSLGPIGSFELTNTAYALRIADYAAPEPTSIAFLGLGLIGMMARGRRRA